MKVQLDEDIADLSFNGHPRIVATAPGRCGIVGNPTDMYGGSIIACSTKERAACILHQETDDIVITVSGRSQKIETEEDLAPRDDTLQVARAVLNALEIIPGETPPFHLEATTDIPLGVGLAGSTAILAAIAACVLEHLDLRLNPYETAELVRQIESDVMGIFRGFQDPYMVTFGGLNYLDFRDKNSTAVQNAVSPFATVEPLAPYVSELPILVAYTGVKHPTGNVDHLLRERWLAGEPEIVDGYTEIAKLARAAKKAMLACDWDALGDLMNRNHALQRDLGGSGDANERLIAAALSAGAFGAKLAGAEAGSAVIALGDDLDRIADALLAAGAAALLYPEPTAGLTVEVPV